MYAGNKTFPKLQLTIGIDSSGSVGEQELSQFHAEMVRLHNMGIDLTVIECDTEVKNVFKFDPKKPFQVNGRGGTAFAPVFEYIEQPCNAISELKELKKEVIKTKLFNIKVCPECWDPDHPQLHLGMYPVNDPQAVREPRPDVSYNMSGKTGLMTNPYDPNVNKIGRAHV